MLLVAGAGPLADGLAGLLTRIPGVEIVGRVEDLPSVLVTVSQLGPTTVVLDSGPFAEQTPAMVRQLRAALPGSRCIVLADDVQQQRAAQAAGADAALLKGCRPTELVATVQGLLVARPDV
ncbi:MAG: hypothetical protein Q8R28_12490 [Dehalococcoidia bacterium]|nr:hypothetical protein [Dehalococcoidia bacterium]